MDESFHNLAKADTGCPFPKKEREAPMCEGALASVSSQRLSRVRRVALCGTSWFVGSKLRGMWKSSTQTGGPA